MVKTKSIYQCQECGFETAKYLGRCPECLSWNAMLEKTVQKPIGQNSPFGMSLPSELNVLNPAITQGAREGKASKVLPTIGLDSQAQQAAFSSGFKELDRVLGEGILPGSYYLLGGDPGIGKSTLMLQMAAHLSVTKRVLYVSGEESLLQLKNRADRLGLGEKPLNVLCNTQWELIWTEIQSLLPEVLVIDSIQSIYHSEFSGAPGSVGQIRDCAGLLMQVAKTLNISIFIIGHVTKEGVVAGPKILEHTVDGVFYLEGDDTTSLRLLTGVKNRFGSTHEIGVFEMTEDGFKEIDNPSAWFLSERHEARSLPGSCVLATMQGNRSLLVEIQALVSQSAYSSPVRNTNGFDRSRLHQIVAILEKRLGVDLNRYDIYINVVGGFKLQETAADLAVALAVISSYQNKPLLPDLAVCGELGLTGELRPVQRMEHRLREAQQLGFTQAIVPQSKQLPSELEGFNRCAVESLQEALPYSFVKVPN